MITLRDRSLQPFDRIGRRCYLVTNGNDLGPVEGLDVELVDDPGDADFLFFTFLQSAIEDVPQFDPLLRRALERKLPFLCSNPDRVAVNAGGMTAAPGSVAARYEEMGGTVVYVGKPHNPIYRACLSLLEGVDHDRIVCIGDSIEHDIQGANRMKLASCFIENGIHRDAFAGSADNGRVLDELIAEHRGRPDFVLSNFHW
ncbi:MAG: TIGR01459 family HAD-type hydrolase [Geminicoccaceae bacterium]